MSIGVALAPSWDSHYINGYISGDILWVIGCKWWMSIYWEVLATRIRRVQSAIASKQPIPQSGCCLKCCVSHILCKTKWQNLRGRLFEYWMPKSIYDISLCGLFILIIIITVTTIIVIITNVIIVIIGSIHTQMYTSMYGESCDHRAAIISP